MIVLGVLLLILAFVGDVFKPRLTRWDFAQASGWLFIAVGCVRLAWVYWP